MQETYEVFAIRYGTHENRTRADSFVFDDDHAAHCPVDYFVWVLRNESRTVVVDTGFDTAEAKARGRRLLIEPADAFQILGIDAATVKDVVITHLHYDHAGCLERFPQARFHLQSVA